MTRTMIPGQTGVEKSSMVNFRKPVPRLDNAA
jgi:hypothetical protein